MLNCAVIMGRLVADLELKESNGVKVTKFTVAVERSYVDKSSGKREADFISVVAWRGTAELVCKYFSKGRMIALEGRIQTHKYEDKDGNKRTSFEIVADQVHFTGEKASNSTDYYGDPPPTYDEAPSNTYDGYEEINTDDSNLPF